MSPTPGIGRCRSVEGDDELSPIWLSITIGSVLGAHKARPEGATTPQRRRAGGSSGGPPRSTGLFIQKILRCLVRMLSLQRAAAKSNPLRCPRRNSPSLAPKKAHLSVEEKDARDSGVGGGGNFGKDSTSNI